MMSQYLGAVGTKGEAPFRWHSLSSSGLRRLAMFAAVLAAAGLVAPRAGAQQEPQPSQAKSTQAAADASRAAATPLVTYEHGQLTIVAENASLSEVMTALHAAMGTEVEIPAGSSSERVWAHLGPGSAHKVLSDLLANTDLDYIVQGSPTDAGGIRSITMSVRMPDSAPGKNGPTSSPVESAAERHKAWSTTAPAPEPVAEPEPTPAPQEASAAPATQATPAAGDSAAAPPATPEPAPTPTVQANMAPTGPSNVFPETPQPSSGAFNPHPSPPPSMSTDQMVQQLTNMYQQRRQMQQGQSGSTPN